MKNFVAIFGESAGAVSVSMHMLSDQSKDLFHKAIMMSGNAYACWALASNDDWPQRLAKRLGWNGEGGESACLAVLQRASPNAIIRMQEEITTLEDRKRYNSIPFSPVIEPFKSEQCFLNEYPKNLISSAWSKHIPTIVGICSNDGYVFFKSNLTQTLFVIIIISSSNFRGHLLGLLFECHIFFILVTKKEPQIVQEDNLKSLLSFVELGTDIESEQCRDLAKQLKYFYFDHLMPHVKPLYTHFMVTNQKIFIWVFISVYFFFKFHYFCHSFA